MSTVPPLQGLLENPRYGELPPDLKIEAIRAWEKDEIERRNTSGDWDLESRANFEVETRRARQAALGIEPQSPEEILKGVIEDENDPEAEQVWDALDEVTAAEREQREINRRRIFPWKREDDDAAKLEAIEGRIVAAKSGVAENEIEQARLGAEALQGKRDAAVVRGKLVLNPELYYDRERYVAAVNSSSATPREKARALAGFYRGREETAKAALPKLRGVGAFRSFADTYATENPEATNGDVVEAFRKSGAGEMDKWYESISSGFLSAMEGVGYLGFAGAELQKRVGQGVSAIGLDSVGKAIEGAATRNQTDILGGLAETGEAREWSADRVNTLGGASTAQQYGQVGGQLFGQVALTMLSGPMSSLGRTVAGAATKKALAAEVGKKLGVGGMAKKWGKETVQTMFSPAGVMAGASSAGPALYESYERNRTKLAAEGLTGPELEEAARGEAFVDATRSALITSTITSLFGLRGVEGVGRLTQVAANPAAREVVKKTVKERWADAGLGVVSEGVEEALDEGINGGLDALLENPDMTFEDWEKATLFAGSAGALFGGSIEGVTQIAEAVAERVKNSPEIRARQETVQSLRASGLNQTADALEQANVVAESDAVAAAIDEVEARAVGAVERLDAIDTELVELAKTPGTEAKMAELEAERDSLHEALMIGRDAMRNYDPVKTANIAVADVVAEGVEPEEARRRVTEVMNARYTNKPVTPQILAAQALAAPAATDTQPTNEEGILQQTEANAQTEAQASEVLTSTEPVSPVTPVKAEPTFRAIAGRPAMVDNEAGDIRIDEDGTVLLDRGPSAPPIIVSRNPDSVISTSEFNVTIDEETEADLEQARVLRTSIGGRPTPRPIERPAPSSTFVRDDGTIVTSFSGERGPVAAVTDFVSEGETEAGDLFVTVKDRETGNEFELHGDDALTVAVARRDSTRDPELTETISAVLPPPVIDFDRALVRMIGPKANLLAVVDRIGTDRIVSQQRLDAALDELTSLNTEIENENFPEDIRTRLLGVVDDAFNDIANVRARVRQRPETPADRGTPAPATPLTGGAEETVDRASAESPETSVTDEPGTTPETPAPVVDAVDINEPAVGDQQQDLPITDEQQPLADDVVETAMAATEGNEEARAELMAALTPEQRARFEGTQEPAVEATPEPEAPATDTATDDFPVDEIPLDASPTGPVNNDAFARHAELEAKNEAGTITPEEIEEARGLVEAAAKQAGHEVEAYHFGWFDPEENPVPDASRGMHFGTRQAAEERASGKPVDDFIANASIEFDDDLGAWFWSSEGIDSYDFNEEGFTSEEEARADLEQSAADYATGGDFDPTENGVLSKVFLRLENPSVSPDMQADWDATVAKAKKNGFDSITYTNQFEDKGSKSFIVFDSNQIKSAEPFTGVPLSQRFNPASDSILEASPATSFTEDSDWQEVTNVLLDRAIAKYPKIPVTKDPSIPAPARTMGLRILVNPTELARYTEGMEVADAAEMLDKLFIHEATHRHAVAEVGDNTVVEYANTMTADERIDTAFKYLHRSAYPSDEAYLQAVTDFAAVDPNLPPGERRVRLYRLGHESFRMNVEILVSGYTTEETLAFLQTNPGNLQRFLRYLGAYLRRLKQWFAARKDPAMGVEVRRLAKVIKTLTKGETVSRGPVNFDPDARGSGRQIIGLAAGPVKQNLWRLTDGRTEWITDGDPVPAGSRKVRSQTVEENPMDADYLAAVERGDMDTAQRMVDEAARAAGYSYGPLFHSRLSKFDKFAPYGKFMGASGVSGIHLTDNENMAKRYLDRYDDKGWVDGKPNQPFQKEVIKVYAKIENPLVRDEPFKSSVGLGFPLPKGYVSPVEVMGHDALIRNDAISLGGVVKHSTAKNAIKGKEFILTDPSKIKSADPVTYDESGNVIPLSQRFNPESDSILETAPVGVWNKPKANTYVPGGGLTAAHRWDRRVYKMLEAARGEYSGYMKKAEFAVKQIARLMKDLKVSETAVNAALGNTENRLTQADVDQIKAIKKRGLAAAQGVYLSARNKAKALDAAGMFADAALARQDAKAQFDLDVQTYQRAAANYEARARRAAAAKAYADRQAAMAALPKPLADEVANLRTEIDLLSDRMIAEGDLSAELKATISANKELWLHRSYQIFDDPNYVAWINEQKDPEAIRLRNKTINYLRQDLVTRKVGELMASGMNRTAATAQAQIDVTDAHVADAFDDYLMVADNGSKTLLTGATVSKEVSALMKRGVIPEEIQELWGRYDDPSVNAAKSIGAIAQHLAIHKFYQDTVALGTKEGWLVKDGPGVLKRDAQGNRLVPLLPNNGMAGRYGNKPKSQYAPLAGYLGPEALRDALAQMVDDRAGHRFIQFFSQLTGYSMASKTVLSWQSGMRNFWGNVLPTMINGNATFNIFDPRYKRARVGAFAQLFARGSAQTRAYVERATALGVLGDSITDNLIRDLTGGFDSNKKVVGLLGKVTRAKFFGPLIDKTRKAALKTYDVSGKAYNMPDEIWKIVNFEGEKARLREMLPNETEEQIEVRAAEIVRNTMPTYSRAPEWVKVLRKFPVMAPFITFPAEMVRITLGQGKVGLDFIREGKATGNKKMEAAGYHRLLASGIVAGAVGSIPAIFKVLSDVSTDDEDDLRKHLAPWEKNVTILFLGRNEDDPSKINYLNLSFMNPYDIWLRPWRSFVRGMRDPNADGFGVTAEAASELVDPIAKEQILFGSLVDTLRGVTATGRRVWDKTDSDLDKAIKSMTHVYNSALEPGTIASIEKIVKAANSEVSVSGRAFNVWQETISAGLGLKANTVDVNSTLAYAAKDFRGGRLDSISVFSRTFKSNGTQSDEAIINSYVEANDKMLRTYRELYEKTVGAVRLGAMTRQEAIQLLRSEDVPADVIGDIMNNRYRRYTPNADSLQDARRKGANLGQDRINLYRQALDRVPPVQQISEDTFF